MTAEPVRVPNGAQAWIAREAWLYEADGVPVELAAGQLVLVVSDDGYVRGIGPDDLAPLAAVLRIDGDVTEIVLRLGDLKDRAAGFDTGLATRGRSAQDTRPTARGETVRSAGVAQSAPAALGVPLHVTGMRGASFMSECYRHAATPP